jgi:hypothetical protein
MRVIFKITNTINSKIYIGKSSNDRRNYLGSGKAIKAAIEKYGKSNFIKEIIDTASSLSELNDRERFWILFYRSFDHTVGYNRRFGGDGNWEYMTPEIIQKRREKQLKTWKSKEFSDRKRSDTLNYYANPENRKAQSERIKRVYLSLPDEKKKEICDRLSAGNTKRWSNPESKIAASIRWKYNNPSSNPANRQKMSESRMGSNNPFAKKCEINGIIYDSIIEACETLGLTRNIISSRIRSKNFPSYKKL